MQSGTVRSLNIATATTVKALTHGPNY